MANLKLFIATIFILLINTVHSFVDLFLNSNDTSNLIGFPGSFFYVYNGELRQNSISHRLDIPMSKNEIQLNWKVNGPEQLNVKYNFEFLKDQNQYSNDLSKFLTIDSHGYVPHKISKFAILFNCSYLAQNQQNTDLINTYFDLTLNISFKLNNTRLLLELQLVTPPPISLSINFRKYCTNDTVLRRKNSSQYSQSASTSFTIAYIIIATLVAFLLIILFVAISMCISSKYKVKKISTKYESLKQLRNKTNVIVPVKNQHHYPSSSHQIKEITSSQMPFNANRSYTSTNGFIKNSSNNKKSSRRQLNQSESRQKSFVSTTNIDESNPNIYESLQDASMSLINAQNQQLIDSNEKEVNSTAIPVKESKHNGSKSHKHNKQILNVTTNTMQSAVFRELYSTNTTLLPQKLGNSEMCDKFNKDQIELEDVCMKGTFSCIYKGTLKYQTKKKQDDDNDEFNDNQQEEVVKVLIKTIDNHTSDEQVDLLIKESCEFRGLKHKNLMVIIGLCLDEEKAPMALFVYPELGNLKTYLISLKVTNSKNNEKLETASSNSLNEREQDLMNIQEILYLILQILKGVNYLHSKHIVHKDIATRNCWLDNNFSLKLSDCALSKDMFPDDYSCLAINESRPIKWMSLESIEDNTYNVRTDIWSCGVVIWECFTTGSQPYENIDVFKLVDYLTENDQNRLKRPLNCPTQLFDIYEKCWNAVPTSRPTLKEIFYSIHKYYTNLNNYV